MRRAGSPEVLRTHASREAHLRRQPARRMTEAAIDPGLTRDLYVSLGEPVGGDAWGVRVYHKPFVDWIWGGCLLMALGGFLALARPPLPARSAGRRRARRGAAADRRRARDEALKFVIPLVGLRAAGRLLAVGLTLDPREVPSPLIGKPAPRVRARAAARRESKPSPPRSMRGKVWLLNVWASWCVSCRDEHPVLVADVEARAWCRSSASTTRTSARTACSGSRSTATPTTLSAFDARAGRHRLRRLRRAGDLRDRQAGRDPLQADRPDHARGAREEDPAAGEEAGRDEGHASRRCCSPSPTLAFGQADEVAHPDAEGRAAPEGRSARSCAASSARTRRSPTRTRRSRSTCATRSASRWRQGKSDDEIRDYMVQRYGDFVLYRPPLQGRPPCCCGSGPFVLLAAGMVVMRRRALAARGRRSPPPARDAPRARSRRSSSGEPQAQRGEG